MKARETPEARAASGPLATFVEAAAIVALAAGDFFGWVPISSTPFFLLLAWLSLRRRGLGWRDLGFARPAGGWARAIALGTLAGAALELFSTYVTVPWLSRLAGRPPDLSEFRPMVGHLGYLLLFLALSWTLAAVGEELAFRGYALNRLAELSGRPPAERGPLAWALALAATSALFGWSHGGQGVTGMVQEGFAGAMLGVLYLGAGRNLAVPIVAHGVSNSVAALLIYFDRYPGV
jgi:membrane protease YdiL (CAAX protease family)